MNIVKKILNFLEKKIKKKEIIIFHSFPDYTDNSYAIFKYMLDNNINTENLIWLYNKDKELEKKIYNEFGRNIKCYKKNSIKGLWNFFRCEKVFCTHGIFSFIKTKKKKINLWHGMPLKNIGFLDLKMKNITTSDYLISTSKIFQSIMAKSFNINEKDVFLTGQPRNDLFFEKSNFYEKKKINKNKYNKIIMYLPTYRKSEIGDIRNDGKYDKEKIGIISINELEILNNNLKNNNNLMLIKMHPMDILQKKNLNQFSNIVILKSKDLEEINEQLYPLLGTSDLLITDYSSVWIDYEILNKPIYFAIDDYSEYQASRGFTIDKILDILPGDVVQNIDELLESLNNIPNKIQKETGDMFNLYKDNQSSKRVLEALNIM